MSAKNNWRCPSCGARLAVADGPFHLRWHREESEELRNLYDRVVSLENAVANDMEALVAKQPRGRLFVGLSEQDPELGAHMRNQIQRENPDLAVTVIAGAGATSVVYVPGDQ